MSAGDAGIARPRLKTPFRWAGEQIAVTLPGATGLFTTRLGGVSEGPFARLNLGLATDDDPERVVANRERVAAYAQLTVASFAGGRQVHGARVQRHERPPDGGRREEADGHATARENVAPIVLTADCLPVLIVGAGAVVALHAGWRGLAAGILEQGVRTLRELGADGPLVAAIGPAAGACCYEVGDEVRGALGEPAAAPGGDRRIDLKAIARVQLAAAGSDGVHDVGLCTICSPGLFFSHRRDGAPTGRQAGIVWRS